MDNSGYVYIMSNISFNIDIFKIGWSRKNPILRAKSLYTTGLPTPFVIEYMIYTNDGQKLEKEIHSHLNNYRLNDKREFFKINKDELFNLLTNEMNLSLTNKFDNIVNENIIANKNVISNENIIANENSIINENIIVNENIIANKKLSSEEIKNLQKFKCKKCNYFTSRKSSIDKHLITSKHIRTVSIKNLEEISNSDYYCKMCGVIYKTSSGLWKHNKNKHKFSKNTENNFENASFVNNKNLNNLSLNEYFFEMLKNNNDYKEIIMKQNKEILQQNKIIVELSNNSNNQYIL